MDLITHGFVGNVRQLGNRVGHPDTALAMTRKLAGVPISLGTPLVKANLCLLEIIRAGFVIPFHERRLVIEKVQVRRAAGHVQVNDAFGSGCVVRISWRQRIDGSGCGGARLGHAGESNCPETKLAGTAQEIAPCDLLQEFKLRIHCRFGLAFRAALTFRPG